ncbi:MAG: T9SS type A sorting domain-containing protein [Fibrobacteres bacterium]|nr:T9SS type A sorting domain-containing protein [Fibrobacterota bacterium]
MKFNQILPLLILLSSLVSAQTWVLNNGITISRAYSGGNIVVDSSANDTIYIKPDNINTSTPWFYWNFSVKNTGSRKLHFKFDDYRMHVNGPCISTDTGATWQWQANGTVWQYARFFSYTFTDSSEVRFAFTIPYTERELKAFLASHTDDQHIAETLFCTSDSGRRVELIRVGRIDGQCKHRIFLSSRHHACEATGSWVLEGMLEAALANDSLGRWCRDKLEILAVPLIDKDGVELGEQGKGRTPHDHNRDYITNPLYKSVRAVKAQLPVLGDTLLRLGLDIHSPGQTAENIHIYADTSKRREAYHFAEILQDSQTTEGHIYDKSTAFNSFSSTNSTTCKQFVNNLPGILFGATIEVPYTTTRNRSTEPRKSVSKSSLKAFGKNVLNAVRILLQEKYPEDGGSTESEKKGGVQPLVLFATPNPFNSASTINCFIPLNSTAEISITTINGKTIKKIFMIKSGHNTIQISTTSFSAGVYLVRMKVSNGLTKSLRIYLSK